MVMSASSEITNITCGHAVAAISGDGRNCDITTPEVSLESQDITGMQGISWRQQQGIWRFSLRSQNKNCAESMELSGRNNGNLFT